MSTSAFEIPTVTLAPSEKMVVVVAPRDLPVEERMVIVGSLISTLSGGVPEHRPLVEGIMNMLMLGIPEMGAVVRQFTSITVERVTPTRQQLLAWVGLAEGGQEGGVGGAPPLLGEVREEARAVDKPEAVYIALSSILFCLGKQASESAKASVLDNRPDALIRRFGIKEEGQVLLPGKEAGPTREVLEAVYNAFSNYTELRTSIALFFLGVRRSGHHLPIPMEIMMTNFQLMRGAGMTHVEAVIKLARSHPWTLRIPELQPFYQKFLADLEEFEKIEEDVRPYHRLLVPQSQYLFLSSELRPLIAVAGSFIAEVEKTFSGYVYNKANYQALIDKVHSFAPNYQPTSGLTKLAALLGVKEEPLPPKGQGPIRDEQDTI